MKKREIINKNVLSGKKIHGWLVKRVEPIKNDSMIFFELEHEKTGAKYVHLETDDKNNAFTVTFKTKPEDSTGVAHILEHTVLTGSKKYPLRDPFFSMLKRSLQTFMNAFTSEDWTAYPFSTQNEKDYFNLLSVYLDAAFFPTISELNFKQEGWRYDFEAGKLIHKGVVFNEMKGSMSSPDRIMAEAIKQSVFDQSSYRFNSGGEPEEIVHLSHEQLKNFHKKFYHPSNAWFFSYGNIALEKTLQTVSESVLNHFEFKEIDSSFILEPRRNEEKKLVYDFPIAQNEDGSKKYQTCLNWLICPLEDGYKTMCAELLFNIMLGNPSAPLRQALIESGLGNDLSDGYGLNTEFRDTIFSVGLKGVKESDVPRVRELIIATVKKIREKGIEPQLVEAVMHKLEIHKKEITNSPYPYGLKVWLDMIGAWVHSGDPFSLIEYDSDIEKLKTEIKKGQFFENLIDDYLIKNMHRSQVVLRPSKELQIKALKKEENNLKQVKKSLTEKDIDKIKNDAKKLEEMQSKEDDTSILPSMEIDDINQEIEEAFKPQELGKNILGYRVNSNGLFYFSCLFDISHLKEDDQMFLPLLSYLLPKMGTKSKNFKELAEYLELNTGGLSFIPLVSSNKKTGKTVFSFVAKGKSLDSKKEKLLDIFKEIILEFDFSDTKLLKRFLWEKISGFESSVVEAGHIYAMMKAESSLSEEGSIQEKMYGMTQLDFLKNLANGPGEEELKKISLKIEEILKKIVLKEKTKTVLLSDEEENRSGAFIKNILDDFSDQSQKEQKQKTFTVKSLKEVREIPSSVSFVAASVKAPDLNMEQRATFFVLAKFLARGFLHNEIREKGGAYGGFSRFSPFKDVFTFGSYRDPHVKRTLAVYSRARDYVVNTKINPEKIKEAIIMSIADLDKVKTEAEKAQEDFFDMFSDYDIALKQEFRNAVLSVDEEKIKKIATDFLPKDQNEMSVAVFGSKKIDL